MRMRFIDTHCHVHFQAYKDDMDDVIRRSLDAGVGMITVGTQSTTSKNGLEVAERYDGVWCTIGLHPNHLHAQEFLDENELPNDNPLPNGNAFSKIKTRAEAFDPEYYRTLVRHPKVVAIGEFGLDYYRVPPGVDVERMKQDQRDACRAQLQFASEVDKPVVIHCRDAHADQVRLLAEEVNNRGGLTKGGVIHCFTGTAEEAAAYRDVGFLVSIGGIVTFGKNVQDAVREIPLAQIMLETDAPYLTPAPLRGKRNEPRYVEYVAEKIAELKGISVDEVARVTTENAVRLFGLERA
ncbi:TatD family hydrolase [Candidatus Uhrbacteria bacterium]|nr:TatD family hydrolase [Candidatus Uhrbacteria bacterium]